MKLCAHIRSAGYCAVQSVNIPYMTILEDLVENEGVEQLVDFKDAGYTKNYGVPKQKVSEEVRKEFETVVDNLVLYRTKDTELEWDLNEISEEYNDNLMEKYESCYEEIKRLCD